MLHLYLSTEFSENSTYGIFYNQIMTGKNNPILGIDDPILGNL